MGSVSATNREINTTELVKRLMACGAVAVTYQGTYDVVHSLLTSQEEAAGRSLTV